MNFKEAWKAVLRLLVFSEFLSLVVFRLNFDSHTGSMCTIKIRPRRRGLHQQQRRVLVRLGNIGQDWRDVPTICIHLRALEMAAVRD